MYDLMILGGGPAGLTATIYALRKRLNALLVTLDLGGKTNFRLQLPFVEKHLVITGQEVVGRFANEVEYLEFAREFDRAEKVEKIKSELVTDEEIEMTKRVCNIMEDLYYSQTTAAQAGLAAQYEVMDLGYDHRYDFKEKIEAVTKEDIREVARKYLNESTTVLITPEVEEYETSMR